MMELNFSNYRIVVQDGYNPRLLSLDEIKSIFDGKNFKQEDKDTVYDIYSSIIQNSYLWICAKYGNPKPCPS